MARNTPDLQVDIQRPEDLSTVDIAAWGAIQQAQPAFSNPLFGHEFSKTVARVRDDVRVAVFRREGRAVGFLAHHRRPGGFARPIGAPFSDYQGIVSNGDMGVEGAEALRLAGLGAMRFNGLVDPHGQFEGAVRETQDAYAIELSGDPSAYLEAIRAASPKKFKNYRRLEHRLEREVGALRFVAADRTQASFDALLAWKSEQFVRTGVQDVLRPVWVKAMMQNLFDAQDGLMVCLYAGDTLVAGHFGVRQGGVFHPWIASANPEFAAMSPGQAFLGHAIAAMPDMGLKVYDLGPGHAHYKQPYASTRREIGVGLALATGGKGRMAGAREKAWSLGGIGKVGAVDKVRRRLDHIAAVDPTAAGRLRGFVEAMSATTKRSLGNDTLSDAAA